MLHGTNMKITVDKYKIKHYLQRSSVKQQIFHNTAMR